VQLLLLLGGEPGLKYSCSNGYFRNNLTPRLVGACERQARVFLGAPAALLGCSILFELLNDTEELCACNFC
jgi:hypothetical protein